MSEATIDLAAQAVARAIELGAQASDALISSDEALSVSCRLGAIEDVERAESRDMGLRVIIGQSQAFVSATGAHASMIDRLAQRAVDMAKASPPDPYCGLADSDMLCRDFPDLDLLDTYSPASAELIDVAQETEDAARAIDGITNSEGASASWSRSTTTLVTSNGFAGDFSGSHFSLGCSVIAGAGDNMQRDYAMHRARHKAQLETAQDIGRRAGERAIRRMTPRKVKSGKTMIAFDPRISASLLGHFVSAISGSAIARGTSFLRNDMEKAVFPEAITIIDDPLRKRGLRSTVFDGEGLGALPLTVVEQGILRHWLLDVATAKQLNLSSNGRAGRGIGSPPAPTTTNLYMAAGETSPQDLLRDMGSGFYVTELIGMGVNGVTGDYSRGAAGFWVENGQLSYPVSEVTIAGNLRDMFMHMVAANDLSFRRGVDAPTLFVEGMTLAGL